MAAAPSLRVAILGLGEAGAAIARDLAAAGVAVAGWDPDASRVVGGVRAGTTAAEAVAGADAVLSVNAQAAAVAASEAVVDGLRPGMLYADLNTASAAVKERVAAVIAPSGAVFADVALLAPVPGTGLRTPAFVSGNGAARYVELFAPLGAPVEAVGDRPGAAATRKLVRSVFMKGLAAAVVESLAAAEAAGCADWLRADIAATLRGADDRLLERLERGSVEHAARRVHEMDAAADLLRELGVEPNVAEASAAVLRTLRAR